MSNELLQNTSWEKKVMHGPKETFCEEFEIAPGEYRSVRLMGRGQVTWPVHYKEMDRQDVQFSSGLEKAMDAALSDLWNHAQEARCVGIVNFRYEFGTQALTSVVTYSTIYYGCCTLAVVAAGDGLYEKLKS